MNTQDQVCPRFSFSPEIGDCETIGALKLQVLLWHVVELVWERQYFTEPIVQRFHFLKLLHGESHSELRLVDHLGFLLCG